MSSYCDRFSRGELNIANVRDCREILMQETAKRLEAMTFELYFRKRLDVVAKAYADIFFSYGWILVMQGAAPVAAFQLSDSRNFRTPADDLVAARMAAMLNGARTRYPRPFRLFLQDGRFKTDLQCGEPWSTYPFQFEEFNAYRPYQSLPEEADRKQIAIEYLERRHSAALSDLVAGRMLLRCGLRRHFGFEPTDLDAVSCKGTDIKWVEFKRKYPARQAAHFGLDEVPHLTMMRLLSRYGIGMSHVILCTPVWDDKVSQVDAAQDPKYQSSWRWIFGALDDASLNSDVTMTTRGFKSGQGGGRREQKAIRWDALRLLHDDMNIFYGDIGALASALRGDLSGLPPVSFNDLSALRRA